MEGALQKSTTKPIVVALDFGTWGSGFAFSVDGGRTTRLFTSWPDQPRPYPKTLTAVLYKNKLPIEFGWTARKMYTSLKEDQTAGYTYVDRFKLRLNSQGGSEGGERGSALGSLPPGVNVVQVIADYMGCDMHRRFTTTRYSLGFLLLMASLFTHYFHSYASDS
jgi:hypothetical protein